MTQKESGRPAAAPETENRKNGKTAAVRTPDFGAPENFYNRELSWLKFDARCLSEARDTKIVPLF